MTINILPAQIEIEELITVFGLNQMPVSRALKIIMAYSDHDNLPLYFDTPIYGSNINNHFEEIKDMEGDITKVMASGQSSLFNTRKQVVAATVVTDQNETDFKLLISMFSDDGDEYYPIDETGMWVEFESFHPNSFYCTRDELDKFISKMNKTEQATTSSPRLSNKKPSKQEQRESAFKIWLTVMANLETLDENKLQECYNLIGKPTKKETWKTLQTFMPKVFNANDGDFFKNLSFDFNFEPGSGKSRNVIKRVK